MQVTNETVHKREPQFKGDSMSLHLGSARSSWPKPPKQLSLFPSTLRALFLRVGSAKTCSGLATCNTAAKGTVRQHVCVCVTIGCQPEVPSCELVLQHIKYQLQLSSIHRKSFQTMPNHALTSHRCSAPSDSVELSDSPSELELAEAGDCSACLSATFGEASDWRKRDDEELDKEAKEALEAESASEPS